MNKDKRDPEYPVELESQFIMRLPEEPAKSLRELLQSGENFKNRLSIEINPDMRHGVVRFDHWHLYGRIMDLPTIVESLKTIDRKSVYKTADICQIMICKTEMDPSQDEESPIKNKKKDTFKVDKKYLWPHGLAPPTKNVRKRRFRKTLKKKNMEAPEIEKEVKRLLRADNEAVSVSWEVVKEEEENNFKADSNVSVSNKNKAKKETQAPKQAKHVSDGSKVEDIFGGALSDSDIEEENIEVQVKDKLSIARCDNSSAGLKSNYAPSALKSELLKVSGKKQKSMQSPSMVTRHHGEHFEEKKNITLYKSFDEQKQIALQHVASELEDLKLRRQRTQSEIAGLENVTLRQRFQDILQTLNRDIILKEKEYKDLHSQ